MNKPEFSVVCVYNDEKVLDEWLLAGLRGQTQRPDLVLVDNRGGRFPSAAAGLNYGGAEASGEYIVFAHQDVRLLGNDWLPRISAMLHGLPALGVAGVAGMRKGKRWGPFTVGGTPYAERALFVFQGPDKEPLERRRTFTSPVEVQTLDEQLLIVPRDVFRSEGFDAETCAGWHLYGVDYSLSARARGLKVYSLPVPVWHRSPGRVDADYYVTLRRVMRKHRAEKVMYTTCGLWYTSLALNLLDLLLFAVRAEGGRWIGRNRHGAAPYLKTMRMMLGF